MEQKRYISGLGFRRWKPASGRLPRPRGLRSCLRGIAVLASGLLLLLAGHEAVHATLNVVSRSSTPCMLCHASHSAAAAPVVTVQALPRRRYERLCLLPARWRPNPALAYSLFRRPPPVLL